MLKKITHDVISSVILKQFNIYLFVDFKVIFDIQHLLFKVIKFHINMTCAIKSMTYCPNKANILITQFWNRRQKEVSAIVPSGNNELAEAERLVHELKWFSAIKSWECERNMVSRGRIFAKVAVHVKSLFRILLGAAISAPSSRRAAARRECSCSCPRTKKDDEDSRQRLHTLRPTVRDLPSSPLPPRRNKTKIKPLAPS